MNVSDIGHYLKEMRKKNNMTQINIAEILNVSPQAVSKWERGECLPDITLFPVIAKVYSISVEDILNAGSMKENEDIGAVFHMREAFVDENLFKRIVEGYGSVNNVLDLTIPFDIFMFLSNRQKDILLDILFGMDGFETVIDEIFQYTNSSQRENVIKSIVSRGDYENLEPLIPFMTKTVRSYVTTALLENGEFGVLEEMLPFLTHEQKDTIITYVCDNMNDLELLDSFIPFLDGKQRKIVYEKIRNQEKKLIQEE